MYPNQQYQPQQQQQMQLPFDPVNPMQGQLNLTLNNPPYVPAYYNCDPRIQQYLPLIAASAAMTLQQRAGDHSLRMFLWNQMAQNNYQNPAFETLVASVCDYTDLLMSKRVMPNLEAAIHAAVAKVIELTAASNVRMFPALGQYVPQQLGQQLGPIFQELDMTTHEITARKQALMQQQQQPAYPQGGGGFQYPASGLQPNAGGMAHSRTYGATPNAGAPSPFINTNVPGRTVNGQPESTMGARFAEVPLKTYPQPFSPRESNVNEQVAAQAVTVVLDEVQAPPEKWVPSKKYPYAPAYNPVTHELVFAYDGEGFVVPQLKERIDMEYGRHTVMGSFGTVPRRFDPEDAAQTLERIGNGLKKFNADMVEQVPEENPKEGEEPKLVTKIKHEFNPEVSLASAWLTGSLERQTHLSEEGKLPDVYRIYACISDPIVSLNDETEVIKNFGRSATYLELREKLNTATDSVSPLLWGKARLKMTELINRVLKQNLGLSDKITSFVDDIQPLIDFIGDTYGVTVQDAFLKYQKENIAAAFVVLPEVTQNEYTEGYLGVLDFTEENRPHIVYLASNYSLTYLNCLSYDLELSLPENGVGSAVTKEITPVMYELVQGIFQDMEGVRDDYYLRNLIRTEDGRILEATKGYIGSTDVEPFYLLTLVD